MDQILAGARPASLNTLYLELSRSTIAIEAAIKGEIAASPSADAPFAPTAASELAARSALKQASEASPGLV